MRESIAVGSRTTSSRFPPRALETLTADRVITPDELERFQFFAFDPGGAARNIDLPAEEGQAGTMITVANRADALEVITVRNDAGGTVVTPTQAEAAFLWCDGIAWYGLVGSTA